MGLIDRPSSGILDPSADDLRDLAAVGLRRHRDAVDERDRGCASRLALQAAVALYARDVGAAEAAIVCAELLTSAKAREAMWEPG